MKRSWKVAALVVVTLAVLGVAAVGALVVRAQSGSDGTFNFRTELKQALANVLGISVEQYDAAVTKAESDTLSKAVTEGWLTQKQADAMKERLGQQKQVVPNGNGFPGMPGFGKGGFGPGFGLKGDSLLTVAANALGMTEADLRTALSEGKSIADVAKEKNVDVQTIVDKVVESYKAKLDQAVTNQDITQKQADAVLARVKEQVTAQINAQHLVRGPGDGTMQFAVSPNTLLTAAAEALGVQESDLRTALQSGKSIADVAKERNVDVQTIIDKYVAAARVKLDKLVQDQQITQKVADATLTKLQESATAMINQAGGNKGWGGFGGRGGRGGFGFESREFDFRDGAGL